MTPSVFTEVAPLSEELRKRFDEGAIIGVDGWTGVGKTTLASLLARELGGATYDLDSALIKDRKNYVSALRLDEISAALAQPKRFILVSGVCLREILEKVQCAANAHIYVKRLAVWGWLDEDEIWDQSVPEIPGASGEILRQEMRRYHHSWRPHLQADYEFHRLE